MEVLLYEKKFEPIEDISYRTPNPSHQIKAKIHFIHPNVDQTSPKTGCFYNPFIPEQGSLEENLHGHRTAPSVSLHLLAPAQDLTPMVTEFPSFAPLRRDSPRFLTEPPWVYSLLKGCHRHSLTAGLPGFWSHLLGCRAGLLSKLLKAPGLGLEVNSRTRHNNSKV